MLLHLQQDGRHQLSWFHFPLWQMAETCLTPPYDHLCHIAATRKDVSYSAKTYCAKTCLVSNNSLWSHLIVGRRMKKIYSVNTEWTSLLSCLLHPVWSVMKCLVFRLQIILKKTQQIPLHRLVGLKTYSTTYCLCLCLCICIWIRFFQFVFVFVFAITIW